MEKNTESEWRIPAAQKQMVQSERQVSMDLLSWGSSRKKYEFSDLLRIYRLQKNKARPTICPSSVFTKVIWLRFLPFSSQSSLPTRWHLHLHLPPLLPLYRSGPFLLTLAFNFNIWLNTKNRGRGSTWGSGLTGKDTCTQIRFFLCIPDTPAMSYMSTRLAKCSMDRGLVVLRVSWSRHPELSKKTKKENKHWFYR